MFEAARERDRESFKAKYYTMCGSHNDDNCVLNQSVPNVKLAPLFLSLFVASSTLIHPLGFI